MPSTVCPFCFRRIDSSHLAYQCAGRGNIDCKREEDEVRKRLTGSAQETYPTFMPAPGRNGSTDCPTCGGPARRRACPECHTALPIDFVDSRSPMIGLVGAKGSGKTVLMTVLVKHLREVIGRRFGADIRIATARSSKAIDAPRNRAPVASSVSGYTGEIRAPQWRHRPRSTTHEITGTFSSAPSSVSQLGQWEAGRTMDSWRGIRHTTTLRKEPTTRPKRPQTTSRNA